jgi:hypothetical protein
MLVLVIEACDSKKLKEEIMLVIGNHFLKLHVLKVSIR